MTSHELAELLLSTPDRTVVVRGNYVDGAWEALEVSRLFTNERFVVIEAPRIHQASGRPEDKRIRGPEDSGSES